MTHRERKFIYILAAIAVVSIPFWPIWGGASPAPAGDNSVTGNLASEKSDTGGGGFPELNTNLLKQQPKEFTGTRRNLFSYESEPSSFRGRTDGGEDEQIDNPEEEGAAEVGSVKKEKRPRKASPRLTDYELTGLIIRRSEKYAVFRWRGEQHFVGTVGQTVNEAFEIKEIGKDFVKIHVNTGDFEQLLRLPAPSQRTP